MSSNSTTTAAGDSPRRAGNSRLSLWAAQEKAAFRKVTRLQNRSKKLSDVIAASDTSFSDRILATVQLAECSRDLKKANAVLTSKRERLEKAGLKDSAIINPSED